MSQEQSNKYRQLNIKNPNHESLIFYTHIKKFTAENSAYSSVLQDDLDIANFADISVIELLTPEYSQRKEYTLHQKQSMLTQKYEEIKEYLEAKATSTFFESFFESDEKKLAKKLLDELTKIYEEKNRFYNEQIKFGTTIYSGYHFQPSQASTETLQDKGFYLSIGNDENGEKFLIYKVKNFKDGNAVESKITQGDVLRHFQSSSQKQRKLTQNDAEISLLDRLFTAIETGKCDEITELDKSKLLSITSHSTRGHTQYIYDDRFAQFTYREISDNVHQSNPDHEALFFYNIVLNFAENKQSNMEEYTILKNDLNVEKIMLTVTMTELLLEKNQNMPLYDKIDLLDKKYKEIEEYLKPFTQSSGIKKRLATELLAGIKKEYDGKRADLFAEQRNKEASINNLKKEYKQKYEEKRNALSSANEKLGKFNGELSLYHVKISYDTVSSVFSEKQKEVKSIASRIEAELKFVIDFERVDVSDQKSMETVKSKLAAFEKLTAETNLSLQGNDSFLSNETKKRNDELNKLRNGYTQEKNNLRLNINRLRDFSAELQKYIDISGSNEKLIGEMKQKQEEVIKLIDSLSNLAENFNDKSISESTLALNSLKTNNAQALKVIEGNKTFLEARQVGLSMIIDTKVAEIDRRLQANKSRIDSFNKQLAGLVEDKVLIMDDIASNSNMLDKAVMQASEARDSLISAIDKYVEEDSKYSWGKYPIIGRIFLFINADTYQARQDSHLLTGQKTKLLCELKEIINIGEKSADSVELKQIIERLDTLSKEIKSLPITHYAAKKNMLNNLNYLHGVLIAKCNKYIVKENNGSNIRDNVNYLSQAEEAQKDLLTKRKELVEMKEKFNIRDENAMINELEQLTAARAA